MVINKSDPDRHLTQLYEKIPRVICSADFQSAGSRSSRPCFEAGRFRSRGRQPHLEIPNGTYFVTWRLADSLPQHVLEELFLDKNRGTKTAELSLRGLGPNDKRKLNTKFAKQLEKNLDLGFGACILKNPELAEIVVGALHHFRGERYQLYSWCVMPNHVHVIFKPFEQFELSSIVHSWKRYSSRQINIAVGRTGELWQREYYDRLIRDEGELERAINYVIENPGKAGLKNWRWMDVGV